MTWAKYIRKILLFYFYLKFLSTKWHMESVCFLSSSQNYFNSKTKVNRCKMKKKNYLGKSRSLLYIVLVTQSCLTLCDPMDYNSRGSSVHGILQARILGWVAIPVSRGSSPPRNQILTWPHHRQIFYWVSR